MKMLRFLFLSIMLLSTVIWSERVYGYEFSWQIDETPQGQESATVVQPVEVRILDNVMTEVADTSSASVALMKHYSVVLDAVWTSEYAHLLLKTFESIPHRHNYLGDTEPKLPISLWKLTDQHVHNDIEIEHHGNTRIVMVAADAFIYATPLLAEIEGLRGKYFSKRLHRAVVRFITDDGNDKNAIRRILRERYDVSIDVQDYTELTKRTTAEDAGRFSEFKTEELLALLSMLEEYPSGMLKTPGLKYLVRRLDGTPHPTSPGASAVAWTSAGYIEFLELAFKDQGFDYIHRVILHEKAHFLWAHLFDDQLKEDWIELGGWYRNPDDVDSWSTTQQTEFVSAYAHAKNPNEDMAESISYYIVRPDKLRSRAPAKYEFIQNRIMHGTRYISQIREDLTFWVYNLYPDYVYPGRIIRTDIKVEGAPTDDKRVTVEIEIHKENELDASRSAYIRVFSAKGTFFEIGLSPVGGTRTGHVLRGHRTISRYAVSGYWNPDTIKLADFNGNARLSSQTDFGWKLYIENPLADCEPPQYVPNSLTLALSDAINKKGEPYQIVTAMWKFSEASGMKSVSANLNDTFVDTYSRFAYGTYDKDTNTAVVLFKFPDYIPGGIYKLNMIRMKDVGLNNANIYFTDTAIDEQPQKIRIETKNPDFDPPELDVNNIRITAEPTHPDDPNGETIVDITFKVKDNISGYTLGHMRLRDPQGVIHGFHHYPKYRSHMYYPEDPTTWKEFQNRIVLPIGSVPGTWGLSDMDVKDKAGNTQRYDFTEIVRFEITHTPTETKTDVNGDSIVNILDLVVVANAFGAENEKADVNGDGAVNILDLVVVANAFGK